MPWKPHIRVVARFNLGPGVAETENASCTLNFDGGLGEITHTQVDRDNIAKACFDAWATYVENASSGISSAVRLMEVRTYEIGTDGKSLYPPGRSIDKVPVKGQVSTNQHPFQVTNVLTLVASPGGKGRFGRIYLPPQGFSMTQDTGQIDNTKHDQMATTAFAFLDDISNSPGEDLGWSLAIAGRTGPEGTLRDVVEVRFGKVPDTQRRRRTNVPEVYKAAAFDA